ncbi:MAG: tyrosine-type recombinase/integrase [Dehalococcoidia bacterium]|nr:tyrosine-type recombinase/integrase [Dehalococcoidia bacterium]
MLSSFLASRRQGLSPSTLQFYHCYLSHAIGVIGLDVKAEDIKRFIGSLHCSNGGRHAYFRALRAFYDWLYSARSSYGLNPQDNPILLVDAPKVERQILPSLTKEQVSYLIDYADNLRDKAIISLFADSGMRLSELTNIRPGNIDWENYTITIWGKGNKQRRAPFAARTAELLKKWISNNGTGTNIWHVNAAGIVSMLRRLEHQTGLKCNPHTFRRTFASNLHHASLDVEHIMRLGGWESLDMVLRYTRSVKFEDSLRLYRELEACQKG